MDKATALRRAKLLALAWLVGAALVFVAASLAPRMLWSDLLRAMAEAAMVGALADWFAVSALFRRIPIPLLSSHTAVIARNKDRIADNLAVFVEEKFLNPHALATLIKRHDPARLVAEWLADPAHARQVGTYLCAALAQVLDMADDRAIQRFAREAMHAAFERVDLSRSLGAILDVLTRDGRHQELLDQAIGQVAALLNRDSTRAFIAEHMVQWLRQEYPKIEKLLPSTWIGEKSADTLAEIIDKLLTGIANDPEHALRRAFDEQLAAFIEQLKHDPAMQARGQRIKQELLEGEAVSTYLSGLWGNIRGWLQRDLAQPDSALHAKASGAAQWIGQALQDDQHLRATLNARLEQAIATLGPEMTQLLTRHISETVKNWDAVELARQVELNIGRDLQYIRINGTVVGALIGAALFGATLALQWAIHR
ncbi:DUF445 domain-containing protein [Herbaspirillum sp. YR522]|uniref:DUF445 domain-containing protein n=1 Tax=Herbaspirillum sp. YR522 TaxID=1144342 RepID=UPI00026F5CF6|nr:DUF445 family protein [Herbaspirillum sp. YR522]EJM97517.1 putative membrane protein [Herbaspirillum sp. YR522]